MLNQSNSTKADTIRLNEREQIQYLLGDPPGWMLRYGLTLIGGFCLLLTGISFVIHYPDVVEVKTIITTSNPPIRIMAAAGGRIAALQVSNGQSVKKGELLAVIDNPADWRDVYRLESWLGRTLGLSDTLPSNLRIGALQDGWSAFTEHWNDLRYYDRFNGIVEKTGFLQAQIVQLQAIGNNLGAQKSIYLEEYALLEKEMNRQRQLLDEKVIADADYEIKLIAFLQQKRQIEGIDAAALQNRMQIKQLESQINDLRQGKNDSQNNKSLALSEDLRKLQSAIDAWKQTYLIVAPVDGNVSFSSVWSVQQAVQSGAEIMAVVPAANGIKSGAGLIAKATLPSISAGKVRTGMKAVVRLDGYPAETFGTIEGVIGSIALLPQGNGYMLDILLSDSLCTTYGHRVVFRQEMSGQATILTEDRKVADRIFGKVRDLIANK